MPKIGRPLGFESTRKSTPWIRRPFSSPETLGLAVCKIHQYDSMIQLQGASEKVRKLQTSVEQINAIFCYRHSPPPKKNTNTGGSPSLTRVLTLHGYPLLPPLRRRQPGAWTNVSRYNTGAQPLRGLPRRNGTTPRRLNHLG